MSLHFQTQKQCQQIGGDGSPGKIYSKITCDTSCWVMSLYLYNLCLFYCLFYSRLNDLGDQADAIKYQGDFVKDLAAEANYGYDIDVDDIFYSWKADKYKDILTYRDQSFASKFTGTKSPIHHSSFMDALDDSLECFMGSK